jgi:hypothetical protein
MSYQTYYCAVCGEANETFVDESNGLRQQYVEDCAVCCRPNVLRVVIDPETNEVVVESEFEG